MSESPNENTPVKAEQQKTPNGLLKKIVFGFTAIILALAVVEGLISLGLLGFDLVFHFKPPLAERSHTQYDEVLGWDNIPGATVSDLYGSGNHVSINNQGFRSNRDYSQEIPDGKIRVICSGDSFTFGYGVGDEDSWVARLEKSVPELEVVNMGQGGYGFDQSYLWFIRDGFAIDHKLHLICLGEAQLNRMSFDQFHGYGKPTLKREGDGVVADHVPVPMRSYSVPWLTQNAEILRDSRIVQFATRVSGTTRSQTEKLMDGREILYLTLRAAQEMAERDRDHGSQTIVVWLPEFEECNPGFDDTNRQFYLEQFGILGIPVIDLAPDFRSLRIEVLLQMFIQADDPDVEYTGAAGHYTPEGNQFVAELLADRLSEAISTTESID